MAVKKDVLKSKYMYEGHFGIEKESLRVDEKGYLSHTSHPFMDIPNIDRDFCENQIEIITDVCDSVEKVYEQLTQFHNIAVERLYNMKSGKEYVWNFSNPPYVKNEQDIPIAKFEGSLRGKEVYREYLASKYGKKKMLFSGIHFNFSVSDKYLKEIFRESNESDYRKFKDNWYLNLAKNVTGYAWLIVYLTAASPMMDGSYLEDSDIGKDIVSQYASARCSEIGYWNDFIPVLSYEDIYDYVKSIQNYVDDGQLKSSSELYYPVRLKPAGQNTLENLEKNGIDHIELRCIDLNPLSEIGLKKEDVEFLHFLLLYLSNIMTDTFEVFQQVMAIKNAKKAAMLDDTEIMIETGWNKSCNIRELTLDILNDMESFYQSLENAKAVSIVKYQKEKIIYPQNRYAVQIKAKFEHNYVEKGLAMLEKYADKG